MELEPIAGLLEKLALVNDVRDVIKELIYQNTVDYKKVEILFKLNEGKNSCKQTIDLKYGCEDLIIKSERMEQNEKTNTNNNSANTVPKLKILNIEKLENYIMSPIDKINKDKKLFQTDGFKRLQSKENFLNSNNSKNKFHTLSQEKQSQTQINLNKISNTNTTKYRNSTYNTFVGYKSNHISNNSSDKTRANTSKPSNLKTPNYSEIKSFVNIKRSDTKSNISGQLKILEKRPASASNLKINRKESTTTTSDSINSYNGIKLMNLTKTRPKSKTNLLRKGSFDSYNSFKTTNTSIKIKSILSNTQSNFLKNISNTKQKINKSSLKIDDFDNEAFYQSETTDRSDKYSKSLKFMKFCSTTRSTKMPNYHFIQQAKKNKSMSPCQGSARGESPNALGSPLSERGASNITSSVTSNINKKAKYIEGKDIKSKHF
jgi:hypothetical protein